VKSKRHLGAWPPMLAHELEYPEVPLFQLLDIAAYMYPGLTAINYYGKEVSYRELKKSVDHLAGALKKRGIEKNDKVIVYMQNSPQFVIAFFAVMRANAVAIPVNPIWQSDELKFVLEDSGATAVICLSDVAVNVEEIKDEVNLKAVIVSDYKDYLPEEPLISIPGFMKKDYDAKGFELWSDVLEEKEAPPEVIVGMEDLAMIPYTSGTTGVPKGCMHSHQTLIANPVGVTHWMRLTAGSVHLSSLPFFHVTGLVISCLAVVFSAGTMVIFSRWDKEAAIDAIEKLQCNYWAAITAMVVDFLTLPDIESRDFSSLRGAVGGGAPMPEAVWQQFKKVTGLSFIEGYGLTESSSATHINPPQQVKFQCLGIPDFGVDARLIDPDTLEEILEANKQGEIILNGPEIFLGYWNRPEDNEKSFIEVDGKKFFRTGDLAYVDEEGYFFLVDRTKRMINAAGFKVWPAEVENYLYKHPDVLEACVVGIPDPKRGENTRAYIVLKPDSANKVKPEDIIEWSKGQMAAYKYPREVIFVDSLPKGATGKILWKQVQDEAIKEMEKNS